MNDREAALRQVLFLALCHTIIIDQKTGKYNSSSPDELALVNAAKQFGYEFKERDGNNNVMIKDHKNNQSYIYQLLNVCEKNDYFPSGEFDQNSLTGVIFLINTCWLSFF